MRRRRAAPETNSLELLLDTMCNAFGGIMFLAFLVVVMPRGSGEAAPVDPQTAAQQLARAQETRATLQARHDARKLDIDALAKRHTQKEIRRARLPRLHEVQKSTFLVVLFENRVYYPSAPDAKDLNERDFKIVRKGKQIELTPRPGKGVDAATWMKSPTGLAALQQYLPRDEALVQFVLYGDSIPAFLEIRNALTRSQHDYNWVPQPPNQPIPLSTGGGSGGPVEAQ